MNESDRRAAPPDRDVTGQVAQFVSGLRFEELPRGVVERARLALLDTVGVALAGQMSAPGEQILAYVRSQAGAPHASVLGGGFATTAPWAALANGVLAHALDYDDTNYGMNGHLSSVLMAVVFALGELRGRAGATCSRPTWPASRWVPASAGTSTRIITSSAGTARPRLVTSPRRAPPAPSSG